MEELVKELEAKAGLSHEDAKKAVEVMLEFVKTKLPEGFGDKFEDILSGKIDLSNMSNLLGMLGGGGLGNMFKGMFGK